MAQYDRKDPYYHQAKREGFASRAVYKLLEIQKKYKLVQSGDHVVDLGSAPGSWLQTFAKLVGPDGRVIGLDLLDVEIPLPRHVTVVKEDIAGFSAQSDRLLEMLGGSADVVVSDMAPNTSGTRFQDQVRSAELVEMAWTCAESVLKPGGHFVAKFFEGAESADFRKKMATFFEKVAIYDPQSTRKGSKERYIVCLEFTLSRQ